MVGTRIVVAILAVLVLGLAVITGVGAAGLGNRPTPDGAWWAMAGVALFIALASGLALLAVPSWKHQDRARRMGLALNITLLVLFSLGIMFGFSERADSNRGPGFLAISAFCIGQLALVAGLFRLRRLVPGRENARSITGIIATTVLATGYIGIAAYGSNLAVRNRAAPPAATAQTPPAAPIPKPTTFRIDEHNFQFKSPGGSWTRRDPAGFNAAASLILINRAFDRRFMVIAEKPGESGGLDNATLVEASKANAVAGYDEFNPEEAKPRTVAGMEGLFFASTGKKGNYEFRSVYWVGVHHGFAYQLVTWGKLSDAQGVEDTAAQFLDRFSLIDPEARAVAETSGVQVRLDAPAYGVSLDLTGTGWSRWKDFKKTIPFAEFGAIHGAVGGLLTLPVSLKGVEVRPEILNTALLAMMNFEYPSRQVNTLGESDADGVHTARFSANRTGDNGLAFVYHLYVLRRGDAACLAVAWQAATAPNPERLDAALDLVTLADPTAEPSGIDMRRQGIFLNNIGLFYHGRARLADAEVMFRAAADAEPNDVTIAQNVVNTLCDLDKAPAALEFLAPRINGFLADAELRLGHAKLLAETGATQDSVAAYKAAFDASQVSAEALDNYIAQLLRLDQPDRAEQDLAVYEKAAPGVGRTLLAKIRRHQQRDDDAVAILQSGLAANPIDIAAAEDLLTLCDELGRHSEVIDAADKLAAANHTTAFTLYHKGLAELNLDRLPAAKATLEAALDLQPDSETVKDLLRTVASRMGQGDTTAIRDPIDAVPLPESALAGATPFPAQGGALFQHRAVCFRFEPGKIWRRTDYYRGYVADRRGIDVLSSFSFDFDPRFERIYVNKLEVRDNKGSVTFTGAVEGYYVSDDSSSDHATEERTLHVPVGSLAPGATVDLIVTREDLNAPLEMPYTQQFILSSSPIQRGVVAIYADGPTYRHFESPTVTRAEIDGAAVFTADHVPGWRREPLQADSETYVPYISICGGADDWETIGREYLGRIAARLEPDTQINDLAARLTAGAADDAAKIRAIARHVQQEYTYKALAFGPRAQIPPPIRDTLTNRYGDCKDHSLLTHLLLRAAGVESRLALTSVGARVRPDMPSLQQFDHMILYLPANNQFIDLTDKDTDPLISTPYGLNGQSALVLNPDHPALITIPEYPADAAVIDCTRDIRIEAKDLIVQETVTLSGLAPGWLRGVVRDADPAELVRQLDPYVSGDGADLLEAHAEAADDTARPLVIKLRYRVPGALIDAGARVAATLPFLWERMWFELSPVKERIAPVDIPYSTVFRSSVTLHLDDGLAALDPASLALQRDSSLATAQRTAEVADGKLLIKTELRTRHAALPASEYGPCAALTSEVLNALERGVVLDRKPKPAP